MVAAGVQVLEAGGGILRSNVYFIRSGSTWLLVDTGPNGSARVIQEAASQLFGADTRPAAILLSHIHPDHSGASPELARLWNCPVYVHADELRFAQADAKDYFATYEPFWVGSRLWKPPPLDRWVLLPMMRLMPPGQRESIVERESLKDRAQPLPPGGEVPELSGWEAVATPGHTPGHVAFFRRSDRLLIAGDAIVTVELNSMRGLFLWALGRKKLKLAGPPWYFTWDWRTAKETVAAVARLRPVIVAPGHGPAIAGPEVASRLERFAEQFCNLPSTA